MTTYVCAFCEHECDEGFCHFCQEYKGVMTLDEFVAYVGEF